MESLVVFRSGNKFMEATRMLIVTYCIASKDTIDIKEAFKEID